jgi:hypothetical protein
MRSIILTGLLAGTLAAGQGTSSRERRAAQELVERALAAPTDANVVSEAIRALHVDTNPLVIPRYRELFSTLSDDLPDGELGRAKQMLALVLLNLGQRDDVYFEELARYARAAASGNAPAMFEYDAEGNENKSRKNPEYVSWCADHHLETGECFNAVRSFALDVMWLAQARDSRAIPILRQTLSNRESGMVSIAALWLAWLNDTASIPLIAASIQRFPPRLAGSIAANMADFKDPRIDPLLDRFVTDPQWRQELAEKRKK